MKRLTFVFAPALIVMIAVVHCSENHVCTEGETQPCTCTDGRDGAQLCNAERTGWDACICADGDADGDSDGDADGDADADADGDADGCTSNDECTDSEASQCDTGSGDCVACADDAHCSHLAETPACDAGTCVVCDDTESSLCTGETPHCLTSDHTCVACVTNDHCADVAASMCQESTHTCEPCAEDADCEHLTGTEHCSPANVCVACTSYNHCDISANEVCNYTTNACVTACEACFSNEECTDELGEGFWCAQDWDGASPHCFQEPPPSGCERPWVDRAIDVISGGQQNLCAPPETTTCLGVVEFGSSEICPPTDDCGEDGISDDAVCIDNTYCSYSCVQDFTPHEEWCPPGTICDGDTNNCIRP
jgi:hypothetical protein